MNYTIRYIDLSWAVVGICENERMHSSVLIPSIEKDEVKAVQQYVIGYLSFWHIAFIDETLLVPCDDEELRIAARKKIEQYIADHPPVAKLPRFYLVLLRQNITKMEEDDMSRVVQA